MKEKRLPAEWEEQAFVQLTFPHCQGDWANNYKEVLTCFIGLVNIIVEFESVLLVCHNKKELSQHFSHKAMKRICFAEIPSNDSWVRDYGGITVLDNGKPVIQNYFFNGWGLKFPANKDNLITKHLAQDGIYGDTRLQTMDMVLEGGSIDSDGAGVILTTSMCLLSPNRNPHLSKRQIEHKIKENLGAKHVLWLNHGYLNGDDTDSHIDMLARFCNKNTIAYVKCQAPDNEHFEALNKMEKELQSFKTATGNPYRLVPLPMPDMCFAKDGHRLPATYANFLIINRAVLVPQYNLFQDKSALLILRDCFPDRLVIGIKCRALIEQHGALHCVTMQYPKGVELKTGS